jgi:ABC-2 type transport system permease protein
MVDGFRYGFFDASDVPPYLSLAVVAGCLALLSGWSLRLLHTGYKLRH